MSARLLPAAWPAQPDLGLLGRSPLLPRLRAAAAALRVKLPPPERHVVHPVEGRAVRFALPVTFTPFASARPCSARCVFCSEALRPREAGRLAATLRPGPRWGAGLERALRALRGVPVGVSLSGLEATDDPVWLAGVLDALEAHERAGGPVEEKVLYTNAAGLARETAGDVLLPRLRAFGLTRAEVSRHHFEGARNERIMRFGRQPIGDPARFEAAVRAALGAFPVRLVCVLQRAGVADPAAVEAYLRWARELGVRDVVFRELSRLGDLYAPNGPARAVARERVPLEPLLEAVLDRGEGVEPLELTAGYYYWNLRLRWRGALDVTFETSDYVEMKGRHRSGAVHKLVFHGNGNLCGDWDPEREVLLRTGE